MKKNNIVNLRKIYDEKVMENKQNKFVLKLEYGSIIGLLGINSAGKTSLFKKIAGHKDCYLTEDRQYCYDIMEKNKNSDISYLGDIESLPSKLKVYESVNYYFDIMNSFNKTSAIEDLRKLDFNLNQQIHTLSQGYKRVLLFILTVYCKAAVYLFDEPLSNVDILMRNYVLETLIKEISNEKIFIITSHELSELKNIFSHIIILNNNKLSNIYEVEKILENKSLNDFYMEAIK